MDCQDVRCDVNTVVEVVAAVHRSDDHQLVYDGKQHLLIFIYYWVLDSIAHQFLVATDHPFRQDYNNADIRIVNVSIEPVVLAPYINLFFLLWIAGIVDLKRTKKRKKYCSSTCYG